MYLYILSFDKKVGEYIYFNLFFHLYYYVFPCSSHMTIKPQMSLFYQICFRNQIIQSMKQLMGNQMHQSQLDIV